MEPKATFSLCGMYEFRQDIEAWHRNQDTDDEQLPAIWEKHYPEEWAELQDAIKSDNVDTARELVGRFYATSIRMYPDMENGAENTLKEAYFGGNQFALLQMEQATERMTDHLMGKDIFPTEDCSHCPAIGQCFSPSAQAYRREHGMEEPESESESASTAFLRMLQNAGRLN